jgi:hypothetical protein
MRFRSPKAPPPFLERRFQRRLLAYVAIAAAVLFGYEVFRAKRPQPPAGVAPAAIEQLDFNVRDAEPDVPLAPGEFRAPKSAQDLSRDTDIDPTLLDGEADPLIDRQLLAGIEDNTLGIRSQEAKAFFAVLDHARRVPTSFLDQSASRDVLYVNLMSDPQEFRGTLVTVTGDLWRLHEFPAGNNQKGLTRLYEGWLFSADSGSNPYRIVATQLGAGLVPGPDLRVPVRVTGYFFKREGYRTSTGMHVAPTLLCKQIVRYRSPNAPPPTDGLAPLLLGAVVAIGLVLTVTILSFAWSDRYAERRSMATPSMLDRSTAARMAEVDALSVEEQLRALSDEHLLSERLPTTPKRTPSWRSEAHHSNHTTTNDSRLAASDPYFVPVLRTDRTTEGPSQGHGHRNHGVDPAGVELPTPIPPTRLPRRSAASDDEPTLPAGAD